MEQISKNTVKGTNQLEPTEYVKFENITNSGVKIMFVGNSITLHGVLPEIGWNESYGMAASKKENDYVHICMREIQRVQPNASFCICQVCEWETDYEKGWEKYNLYEKAREFNADIIIMRAVENCSGADFDKNVFIREYGNLLAYLNPDVKAKFVITTGFWKHPADDSIKEFAAMHNLPLCELGDLGEKDEMKAIGKFEHSGVANHPGDLGMQNIAERILKVVLPMIQEVRRCEL